MNDNPFQDDINAQGLGAEPISEPSTPEGPYVINTPKEETQEEEAPIDPEMSRRMDEVLNGSDEPNTSDEPIVRGVEIPVDQPVNDEAAAAAEPVAPVEPAEPVAPVEPAEAVAPVETSETAAPVEEAAAPAEVAAPVESVEPEVSAEPVTQDESEKMAETFEESSAPVEAQAEMPVEPAAPVENVAPEVTEMPVANDMAAAPKKKSSPVTMIVLVVVLLLAVGGVVAAVALNGGFGGNSGNGSGSSSSSNKEDTPTPDNVKQAFGTEKQGYISLPNEWIKDETTAGMDFVMYLSPDSTRSVKMETFVQEGSSAKTIADELYQVAMFANDNVQPQMTPKTVNGNDGYTVYYYEESAKLWRFKTVFIDTDNKAHIISISTPDETDELLTSVIDSWRPGLSSDEASENSDSSSESEASVEEVVEKNQEVSTNSSAALLEREPEE